MYFQISVACCTNTGILQEIHIYHTTGNKGILQETGNTGIYYRKFRYITLLRDRDTQFLHKYMIQKFIVSHITNEEVTPPTLGSVMMVRKSGEDDHGSFFFVGAGNGL